MELFEGVDPVHLVLAYAGMSVHILTKLAEFNKLPNFSLKSHVKRNIYSVLATIIMVPLLLIMTADASIKDILPINKVTAVLAGWQTQSTFATLMNVYANRKLGKKAADEQMG